MPDVTARALIGHTGLVGSNLLAQRPWDACVNSKNADALRDRAFDVVACAAMYAEKWRINQDPGPDRANLDRLTNLLATIDARRFVLISTVDVYPIPVSVSESSPIAPAECSPYGAHRLELEQFVRTRFPEALVLRLPALVGPGLKKNAVFDLAHDHRVEFIHPGHEFQFFPLPRLGDVMDRALDTGLRLLNLATEPIPIGDIAREVFERNLVAPEGVTPVRYDFHTEHAALLGGTPPYLMSRAAVMDAIAEYAART